MAAVKASGTMKSELVAFVAAIIGVVLQAKSSAAKTATTAAIYGARP
jgi:hypothetical protein